VADKVEVYYCYYDYDLIFKLYYDFLGQKVGPICGMMSPEVIYPCINLPTQSNLHDASDVLHGGTCMMVLSLRFSLLS
jgi:hypothetical protein